MSGLNPSVENIAVAIWKQLIIPVQELGVELHGIRIEETENNFVEYFGAETEKHKIWNTFLKVPYLLMTKVMPDATVQ